MDVPLAVGVMVDSTPGVSLERVCVAGISVVGGKNAGVSVGSGDDVAIAVSVGGSGTNGVEMEISAVGVE